MTIRSFLLTLLTAAVLPSPATFADTPAAPPADALRNLHLTPESAPVQRLEVATAFGALTPKEKLYAHWMSEASWSGNRITFSQVSAESPAILELLQRLFSENRTELRRAASRAGVSDAELEGLKAYAATFYSNAGNYHNFGYAKFIPRIPEDKLALVVKAAASLSRPADTRVLTLWDQVRREMYSLDPGELVFGLEGDGTSSYYSEDVTKGDIELVKEWMTSKGLNPDNTRLFTTKDGALEIRTASSVRKAPETHTHKGRKIVVSYGDHADILADVVRALEKAHPHAANPTQADMVRKYTEAFRTGDMETFKESQRLWVKDVSPSVETNIGFIESYADPAGMRGEWEGFVSIVNREQSRKFQTLVDAAPSLLPLLPWGRAFEKDEFQRPDFSSLDVLAFASSGIPAGINIPNFDDIRQTLGFKNVSLGNVLSAGAGSKERKNFASDADQALLASKSAESFEVQVGLHELLGHGSGKLLMEKADQSFNFDRATVTSPITKQPVATWYKPGETWATVFGPLGSAYEECRAEAVGLYLSTEPDVLRIFGHEGEAAADLTYVNWLNMARAGADALRYYDPRSKTWGQAHMQGRYALMNVMLRAGGGLLSLEKNAAGDWVLALDRSKIVPVGKPAIADFLRKLGVYKATADVTAGRALFQDVTSVDGRMAEVREYAIAKRKPRALWAQPVTDLDSEGRVILREYPATVDGVIDSFQDRYSTFYR